MPTGSRRLTRFVWVVSGLAASCLAGSVALILLGHAPAPSPARLAAVAALSTAAVALRLDIRLGSQRLVFAWGDTALVLALLLVPAPWVVLVTTVAKAAAAALTFVRQQPVKLVYNAAAHVLAAMLASVTVALVGRLPLDIRDARDVAALLAAGAVYDLTCNAFTAAVIATANGSRPRTVWRAGLGLQTLTMGGNLAATAGALALAGLDHRLILLLPVSALVLQQGYRGIQRGRTERESGRRLARAIGDLADLDEATILSRTGEHAAALLSADGAEVVLHHAHPAAEPAVLYAPAAAQARPSAPWWTETVDLLDPDGDVVGEIRVHFGQPVSLSDRERAILSTLAAATRNALAAAYAHAETEHLAAVRAHEASHDPVTGLPNRQLLLRRVETHLDKARRGGPAIGMILIDLVELAEVSRTLGHDTRDQLLRHAADRLRHATTLGELSARLDTNEFAVFVHEVEQPRDLQGRANHLLAALATPTRLDAGAVSLDAAAGIAYAQPAAVDSAELLRQATVAAALTRRTAVPVEYYRASEDTSAGPSALLVAAELQEALRGGRQLTLHYQPIVDLRTGAPVAAEALVRWYHPSRGLLPPQQFIPVLEQGSLLGPYTDWLLRNALAERARWTDLDPGLAVSVNLSARSLLDRDLPARVSDAVAAAGLRPQQVMLELTESTALSTMSTVDTVLEELTRFGVRIAVDDFGSGHSSLHRLTRVPATDLKIAPDLVENMLASPEARGIVRAAAEIARSIDLRVTAVGARTLEHLLAARDAGAHAAQGRALGAPQTASQAHAVLLERTRDTAAVPGGRVIQFRPHRDRDDPA
jgi:diguanylate cyclase (GGDEF)-like protein